MTPKNRGRFAQNQTGRKLRIFIYFPGVEGFFSDKFGFFAGLVFDSAVEAGLVAGMALACVHFHLQNKAILVAIDEYLPDFLEMARLLTFFPEFFSRTGIIHGVARRNGLFERFSIHISNHQYLAGRSVLGDGGDEAVRIELRGKVEAFFNLFFVRHNY